MIIKEEEEAAASPTQRTSEKQVETARGRREKERQIPRRRTEEKRHLSTLPRHR
jgi:hypothetical protein